MTPALLMLAALSLSGSAIAAPPPAALAGYTTLAFHSDFTAPMMGNTSNWLDCAGAPRPRWWIASYTEPLPPCSRVSMAKDGGVQVLDMQLQAADVGSLALELTTVNSQSRRFDQGVDFPNGVYRQVTFRLTEQTQHNNPYCFATGAMWTWPDTFATGQTPSGHLEFDDIEWCANGGDPSLGNDDSVVNTGHGGMILDGIGTTYYQIDPTVYHTYGALVTQNGTDDLAACIFIDGTLQRCKSMKATGFTLTTDQLTERNYGVMQVGDVPQPVWATMDILVKDYQVWTCAGWRGSIDTPGNQCNGPLVVN